MSDRHFDELATHFANKIYGGAKGQIRLAVLQADLIEALPKKPLRVLDIGAGLGHMSLWLAGLGHDVTLAEPAAPMLEGAKAQFAEKNLNATFIHKPWQALEESVEGRFDVVICHAVLEWLADPFSILPTLKALTAPEGWLSLAFYNQDALTYRNLLKGNFNRAQQAHMPGQEGGLTPQRPIDPRALAMQLEGHWSIQSQSGVRVFHDYMPSPFQQKADRSALVEMELAYRRHPSFMGLGRYLHWLCRPIEG